MVTIHVTITGASEYATKFTRLRTQLHNRRVPMERTKTYMVDRWQQNFASNGGIYGGWAALSQWSWRRGPNHGGTPLHLSGALEGNVSGQGASGAVTATSVDWHFVNRAPSYPLSHQFGWNPYFDQPARIIWATNGEDQARIEHIMELWVNEVIGSIF